MSFASRVPGVPDPESALAVGLVSVVLGAPVVTAVGYGVGDAAVVLLVALGIVTAVGAAMAF